MQRTMNDFARLMTRRTRSGQSIIIIALGFIVLIAFVGIATDTALLFVRFSTLRRAVDAAAVAAAGQVRENSTYANVAAAAQQYIQLHGLQPSSVRVDTCETEIDDWKKTHTEFNPGDARAALVAAHNELCKPTPAKLVRVSAQIISPTTFLSIIGYRAITLSASSVSQTAVMDVVMMLDGSFSMKSDTQAAASTLGVNLDAFPGWAAPDTTGFSLGLDPYDLNNPGGLANTPPGLHPKGSIRAECRNAAYNEYNNALGNYAYGGCCNDPSTQAGPGLGGDASTWYIDIDSGVINAAAVTSGAPDENFSDLLCRPFKDVRDASRRFLKKIDFVRGDRVIMIQFDAAVHQVGTGGYKNGAPVMTTRADAITSLNKYVGIEENPTGAQDICPGVAAYDYTPFPYTRSEYFYETIAQCVDTNTGGAIQAAQALLTDPAWIRRDSVWIAVLLSDGYPNRTPGVKSGLGDPGYFNPAFHRTPNVATASGAWPTNDTNNGRFFNTPLLNSQPDDSPLLDPGFCPWSTFCDHSAGTYNTALAQPYSTSDTVTNPPVGATDDSVTWNNKYCLPGDQDNQPIWWNLLNNSMDPGWHEGGAPISLRRPFCSNNNPDVRHFCMDPSTGAINPQGRSDLCSRQYDPMDFARDRVDFAALSDYLPNIKGNFIAMFSIFFPHSSSANVNENILGVKFMRYMADAGDNGQIDNLVQKWYRNKLFSPGAYQTDPVYPDAVPGNDSSGYMQAASGLTTSSPDPCEAFDFREKGSLPGMAGYEELYKQSCGNYYYAGNSNAIDRAFTDIAGRLFTRLAR